MAKKFDEISIEASEKVEEAVTEATKRKTGRQGTASPEEAEERARLGITRGRKGTRMPKLNVALWADNYQYVKTVSRVVGVSMNDFINQIIQQHSERHPEILQQALDIMEKIKE